MANEQYNDTKERRVDWKKKRETKKKIGDFGFILSFFVIFFRSWVS